MNRIVNMFIESEIFEDAAGNLGQAAGILRGGDKRAEVKAKSKEEIKALADVTTEPHVDKPPQEGGQHIDLPYLAKWLKDGAKVDDIARIYSEFMDTPELRKKLMVKKFSNPDAFMQNVHKVKSSLLPKGDEPVDKKDFEPKDSLEHAKRYEDENIKVYLGTDEATTRELSCYNKYGLCIGASGGGNWFSRYRYDHEQSTYFVHFKNDNPAAKAGFIIIDINSEGGYLWNPIKPNNDISTSERELTSKYPDLAPAFQKGIFKYVPPTEEEIVDYNIVRRVRSILEFYKNKDSYSSPVKYVEYMIEYAKRGYFIKKDEWGEIQKIVDTKTIGIILKAFVEQSDELLPDEMYSKLKGVDKKRYWNDTRSDQLFLYATGKSLKSLSEELQQVVNAYMGKKIQRSFRYVREHGFEGTSEQVQKLAIEHMSAHVDEALAYITKHGFEKAPEGALEQVQKIAIEYLFDHKNEADGIVLTLGFSAVPEIVQNLAIQHYQNDPSDLDTYIINKGFKGLPEKAQRLALQYYQKYPNRLDGVILQKDFTHVPEEIQRIAIQNMKEDAQKTYDFIYKHGLDAAPEEVQKLAIQLMKEKPWFASDYVKKHGLDTAPEEVQKLAFRYMKEKPKYAVKHVLENGLLSVPEEIQKIAISNIIKDKYLAMRYIVNHSLSTFPEELQKVVAGYMVDSDPSNSNSYVLKQGLSSSPEEIQKIAIKYMIQNEKHAFEYVNQHGLESAPESVQQEAVEYMIANPEIAKHYVINHGFESAPKIIQKSARRYLQDNPYMARDYVIKHGLSSSPEEIQEIAIERMIKYPDDARSYVSKHGFEGLPKIVQEKAIEEFENNEAMSFIFVTNHGVESTPEEVKQVAIDFIKKNKIAANGTEGLPPEIIKLLTESTTQKIVRMFVESETIPEYGYNEEESEKIVITFDFDDTLQLSNGVPRNKYIDAFKNHMSQGHEVHIVTSRMTSTKSLNEIQLFARTHGLNPASILHTDGKDKAATLKNMGSQLHYDDDEVEIEAANKVGIKTVNCWDKVARDAMIQHMQDDGIDGPFSDDWAPVK